jgi:hypothetical protein
MGTLSKGHSRFLQVSVAAKEAGASFWRAGVKHTTTPVNHPLDKFDADQTEALFNEPKLNVAFVDVKNGKDEAAAQ